MSERDVARQRRAAQNRRQRDARAARVAKARTADGAGSSDGGRGAAVGSSSRRGRGRRAARSDSPGPAPAAATAGSTSSRAAGRPGRTVGGRSATADARRADRTEARRRRWRDVDSLRPGERAVKLATLLALAAAMMLYLLPLTPVDPGDGKEVEAVSYADETGPSAIPFLLIPVMVAGIAWLGGQAPRRRRRIYLFAAVMQVLSVALIGPLYLVSALALGLAAWQAGQAENESPADTAGDADDAD